MTTHPKVYALATDVDAGHSCMVMSVDPATGKATKLFGVPVGCFMIQDTAYTPADGGVWMVAFGQAIVNIGIAKQAVISKVPAPGGAQIIGLEFQPAKKPEEHVL